MPTADAELLIVGALPGGPRAPLRIARWADLLRVLPAVGADPGAALRDHPALAAAWCALLHRVRRVTLVDADTSSKPDAERVFAGLPRDSVALFADGHISDAALPALDQLVSAGADCIGPAPAPGLIGVRPGALFIPPGLPAPVDVDGALVAPALLLGTSARLGPQVSLRAPLSPSERQRLRADGLHTLTADARGAVSLERGSRVPALRPPAPARATTPAPRDPAGLSTLRARLAAIAEAHAFPDGPIDGARQRLTRALKTALDDARAKGLITTATLSVHAEGQRLVADVALKLPRRVEAVQLRLSPLS